jgi:two-component system, NarL family, invasion response regulator UvrY
MKSKIKVILADDHPLLLAGFSAAIASHEIEVVATCATVEEALIAHHKHKPVVLVLDVRFGTEQNGLTAGAELLRREPDAKVVFLSQFSQTDVIKEAYQLGAMAYVTKDCEAHELAQALQEASRGKTYFLPSVALKIANSAVHGDAGPQQSLDERQLQIFIRLAQGMTIPEISVGMGLSVKTISNESVAIKERLNVHRPAQLTLLAVKHHLLKVNGDSP